MAKYEAHITCPRDQSEQIKRTAEAFSSWKYSAFDADPIMGDKPFAYLTSYDTDERNLLERTNNLAKVLENNGVTVLRQKIERIIYDTKTIVNEIN